MNLLSKWSISALIVAYTCLSGCSMEQNTKTNGQSFLTDFTNYLLGVLFEQVRAFQLA